jgi:hypothetical protein
MPRALAHIAGHVQAVLVNSGARLEPCGMGLRAAHVTTVQTLGYLAAGIPKVHLEFLTIRVLRLSLGRTLMGW